MKKILLHSSLILILFVLVSIFFDNFTLSQDVLASKEESNKNNDNESRSSYDFYTSYDSISSESYGDSFLSSIPSTYKIADALSNNFVEIIDTQLSTGLEN